MNKVYDQNRVLLKKVIYNLEVYEGILYCLQFLWRIANQLLNIFL